MIQINKTFFQFTKRLLMVMVVVSASNLMYGGGWHGGWASNLPLIKYLAEGSADHKSSVEVEANGGAEVDNVYKAAGTVYVSKSEITKNNDAYIVDGLTQKENTTCSDKHEGGMYALDEDDTHPYYILAIADPAGDFLWDGWYEEDASAASYSSEYTPISIETDPNDNDNQSSNITKKYIAKWLCPTVLNVSSSSHTEIVYSKAPLTKKVIFTVKETNGTNNFEFKDTDNANFTLETPELNDTKTELTTGLKYTPTGVHTVPNQHVIWTDEEEDIQTNTLTVKSKYKGFDSEVTSKTFTLTVKEDYTPRFEMEKNSVSFIDIPPGTSTTELTASDKISPKTTWNWAAQQPGPSLDTGDDAISTDDDKLINGCQWEAWIEGADHNCFSISGNPIGKTAAGYDIYSPEHGTPIVTFSAPEGAQSGSNTYSATLHIKCKYYDAHGNCIPAMEDDYTLIERIVVLNAKAEVNPMLKIDNKSNATIVFSNVICGSTPLKYSNGDNVELKNVSYITNIANITESSEEDNSSFITITPNREYRTISAMLHDNITPGTHTAKLNILGVDENNSEHEASLTVTANVILAKPVLYGSAGNASATLTWSPVPGATSYEIYYKEGYSINNEEGTSVACKANEVEKTITGLTNDHTYSFIIVAKYNKDASLDAVSNVVTLRPTDFSETIDWAGRLTSLKTGTQEKGDIDGSNFPYMTLRQVDVTAAFDETEEGEQKSALFDYVVIFEKTTFADETHHKPTNDHPSTACTPCYVYKRQADGKTYKLLKIKITTENGTETEVNYIEMNAEKKHPGFTIDATQDDDKKISIYITGFCPFASTGTTWGENAVMHITGSNETTVDIYLDNAQIYARPKSNNTTTSESMQDVFGSFSQNTGGYMNGSGAVLAFSSDVMARFGIHIRGNNILKSHDGVSVNGTCVSKFTLGTLSQKDYTNTFYGEYTQASSPIQILPTTFGTDIELSINDLWPNNYRQNGKLKLQTHSTTSSSLIDLGNENSSVSFDGGYVTFDNTKNVLLASYRKCIRTDQAVVVPTGSGKNDVKTETQHRTIYGATTAAATANSGTKASHNETAGVLLSSDASVHFVDGTYSSSSELTVPMGTKVDGGSYRCKFATTMSNSYDKELTLITTDIPTTIATVNDNNGVAMFIDGLNSFRDLMDYIYPSANWMDQENPTKHYASLSTYYNGVNKSYGYSSLTPDANNKVYLLLPKDGNPIIKNWAISGPSFNAKIGNETTPQESAQTIYCTSQSEANTFGKTYNMLYMETDGYTQSAVADGSGYGMSYVEGENKISVTITSDCATAKINNNNEYIISDRVYIMKPLVATDWMLYCPPFDVANVYIVEAYPEKQLIEDYKGDNKVSIPAANIQAARKAQAQRFMDLYVYWYNHGEIQGGSDYFYDEANDALGQFIMDWAGYETKRGKDGIAATGNAYQPVINKLQHFMGYEDSAYPEGMHWWDANYFLYESVGAWTPTTSGDYTPTWNEVKKPSKDNNAIMKVGKVYAMNFPYNVIGGHNPETTWDYWTGKYIIIESTKRPEGHTIQGGSYDMQGIKTTNDNEAWMCGNPTFKTLKITAADDNQVYSVNNIYGGTTIDGKDTTIVVNSYTMQRNSNGVIDIPSTRGFVLANPPAPVNMRARAINYKTGEVTYEKVDNPDDDNPGLGSGVPTIMNGMTLIVEPTEQGLTITPIKEQHVMLFDADGKMIFSKHLSAEENVTLPTGVYVVRGEYEQVKAIKK